MKIIGCILLIFSMNSLYAGQLSAKIENDGAFGDDGHYTSGLYLSWESKAVGADDFNNTSPLVFQAQHLLLFPQNNHLSAWSTMLSQRIWTPTYIRTSFPQTYDRPYAGILELTSTTSKYSSDLMQRNWIAIGTTGAESLGGELQVQFHKAISSFPAQGWETQLEQQITWQVGYDIEKLLLRTSLSNNWQWDTSFSALADIGNFRTEVFAGVTIRFGQQLAKSFGRINNRHGTTGNLVDYVKQSAVTSYVRAQIGYRHYDVTIEGNFPYNSPIVRKSDHQKYTVGVQWLFQQYMIDFSVHTYSKDYTTNPDSWHGYGGLALAIAL